MDGGDEWMVGVLQGVLPDETLQLLQDHVLHPQSPFQIIKRQIIARSQQLFNAMYPILRPLIDQAIEYLSNSPDLVNLGVFLIGVFAFIQVVMWVFRVIQWWARLAMKAFITLFVVLIFAMIWQRGPEGALRDVVVIISKLAGYGMVVKNIWLQEYDKYNAQAQNGGRTGSGSGRGGR